jgi:hypothetical protein
MADPTSSNSISGPSSTTDNPLISYSKPTPNKKQPVLVGSDLMANFISDLWQCRLLRPEERYTHNGSFEGRAFLCFNTPPYVSDAYPNLLSMKDDEKDGLPLTLTTFLLNSSFTEEAYNGQWFMFNTRILPYKLPFERKQLDGWEETVDVWSVQKVALALPRDGAMQR